MTPPDTATRALEHALARLRLHGAVYCLFEGHDAWGLRLPEAPEARFHAVRRGRCWLRVGDDPVIELGAGDLILLPQGTRHDVLASPDSDVIDVMEAFGSADPHEKVFRMGRGDPRASLVCGGFSFEDRGLHPLPTCLPKVMHLRADDSSGAGLRALLDLAHAELAGSHLASDVVLGKLSDILFITVVRTYAGGSGDGSTWLAALTDAVVGPAMAAVHEDPTRDWSVTELAAIAGVSKSTLTARFQELVGVSPARYVTRWRMLEAKRLLSDGEEFTVAKVSERVGYASEAAFSRAFHREIGQWPSEYRPARPTR